MSPKEGTGGGTIGATSSWDSERVRLAALLEVTCDAIVVTDANARVLLFPPAAERMFRAQAADVTGRSIDSLIPGNFVMDVCAASADGKRSPRWRAIDACRADGEPFAAEVAARCITVGCEIICALTIRDLAEELWTMRETRKYSTALTPSPSRSSTPDAKS